MEVKYSALVSRALMLLDENENELDAAVGYGDMGMELRRLAGELAPEAVRKVLEEARFEEIDEVRELVAPTAYKDGVWEMRLPTDFLRIVELRMSDWKESLYGYRAPEETAGKSGSGSVLRHHPEVRWAEEPARTRPGLLASSNGAVRVLRIYGSGPEAKMPVSSYLPAPSETSATVWIPGGLKNKAARELATMVRCVITD